MSLWCSATPFKLVTTVDVPATFCAAAGTAPDAGLHGRNLLALLEGSHFPSREFLTCRYGNTVWYRDERNWYFSDIFWRNPRLFDLEGSEPFAESVAARAGGRMPLAQRRILEDAGDSLPAYRFKKTDMVKAPFI